MPVSLIPHGKNEKPDSYINIRVLLGEYKYLLPVAIIFSLLLIFYVVGSFWVGSLDTKIINLQNEKEILLNAAEDEQSNEVKQFAKRTRALQELLDTRSLSHSLFSEFEASIHLKTILTDFELDTDTGSLFFKGSVPNFEILGQQFVIWNERAQFVKSVDLKSFNKNSGGQIEFEVDLVVKRGYLE